MRSFKAFKGQLPLSVPRERENDRNYSKGGRSFYFFDFDDNIAFLDTPIYLFHKKRNIRVPVSSGEFARLGARLGQEGKYKDFEVRSCPKRGSFKNFRDRRPLMRFGDESFVRDIKRALRRPIHQWQGPSWPCFYHAVFNQRPLALITARGHHPETIKLGLEEMVRRGHLPHAPNYLEVFPVNHNETRHALSEGKRDLSTADLKRKALRRAFSQALKKYGDNPHHRFGMSDDDPKNIEMIQKEMSLMKSHCPEMSFFIINTEKGEMRKDEVTFDGLRLGETSNSEQMSLF